MSKIKHRTLVHIALNAKGERVGSLASACGRLIPFGYGDPEDLHRFRDRPTKEWIALDWGVEESLHGWKKRAREYKQAVRFQRAILVGDDVK